RRDRRLRIDWRHCLRRRSRRPDPAVRELLRLERPRRSPRRAPAGRLAPAQARRARTQGGALTRLRALLVPVLLLVGFAIVPKLSVDLPILFGGPLDSPGPPWVVA